MKYDDIETAFEYVNFGELGDHNAYIHRETGQIYYTSEMGDSDELPDDFDDNYEQYIDLPHKNDLDLGSHLVRDFAYKCMPEDADIILGFFRRRGAYGHFKDFLERKDKLKTWYDFEHTHTKTALLEWCKDNHIELTE